MTIYADDGTIIMRTYFSVIIHTCALNSSGMRYYALTKSGRVMADTLAGIKKLIREAEKTK